MGHKPLALPLGELSPKVTERVLHHPHSTGFIKNSKLGADNRQLLCYTIKNVCVAYIMLFAV